MEEVKKLSVVIPVYNEERTIGEIMSKVSAVDLGSIEKEIVVINDGSRDGTLKVLKRLMSEGKIKFRLINHRTNKGKSSALRTGFRYITGDVVVVQDGDMEYNPSDFRLMLKKMAQPGVKVVYGSRNLGKKKNPYSGLSFYAGGLVLTYLTNILYGSRITDEPTCYKMFDSNLLKSLELKAERFEFCPEVTAKTLRRGVEIHEVPISYNPRNVVQGKKIAFKDFWEAVYTLLKYRWSN